MKITDLFALGSRNLMRRKLRTLLTVVGVMVGTTAIVMMISLGIGMNESLDEMISQMGDLTVITLNEHAYIIDKDGNYHDGQNTLNDELVEKIKQLDGVVAVMPQLQSYNYTFKITANKRYENYASIVGVDPAVLPAFGYELEAGSMPEPNDKYFVLFGAETLYDFYNPKKVIRDWYKEHYYDDGTRKPPKVDVLSARLQVFGMTWDYNTGEEKVFKKRNLKTVGVLKLDEQNWETSYNIYMHIDLVREMILEQEKFAKVKSADSTAYKYNTIKVKTASIKDAERVQEEIKQMGVMTYGLSDYRKQMQEQQAATQYILAGIGAMSLFVAAIGIANTMIMSIYERTREIGVMKVLGCPLYAIRGMFLYEASMIGFIGGIIGVGLSLGVSYMFNNVEAFSSALGGGMYGTVTNLSVIPPWLILMAIIFSTLVGLVSGYLPARRATKVSALEAIRNDA
ncbi:MAG: ABC transporter permease [Clostridiales bacterium]|nr:ABC transporter permease [Clostridiales bacterium]